MRLCSTSLAIMGMWIKNTMGYNYKHQNGWNLKQLITPNAGEDA